MQRRKSQLFGSMGFPSRVKSRGKVEEAGRGRLNV